MRLLDKYRTKKKENKSTNIKNENFKKSLFVVHDNVENDEDENFQQIDAVAILMLLVVDYNLLLNKHQ